MRRDDFEAAVSLLAEHGLDRLEQSLSGADEQVRLMREDILRAERKLHEKVGRAHWASSAHRTRASTIRSEEIPYQTQEFNLVGSRAPLVQAVIGRRIKALGDEGEQMDEKVGFRVRQIRREARVLLSLEGQVTALEESYELISIAIDMGYHLIRSGFDVDPLDDRSVRELSRAYPVYD